MKKFRFINTVANIDKSYDFTNLDQAINFVLSNPFIFSSFKILSSNYVFIYVLSQEDYIEVAHIDMHHDKVYYSNFA